MSTSPSRPDAGPARTAAIFDFDGTIIDGFSAKAVIADRTVRGDTGPLDLLRLARAALKMAAGHDVMTGLLEEETAKLAGRSEQDLAALGDRVTRKVIGGWLHSEASSLIAEHQRKGDIVAIASAALPFQIEPLAAELGVDHVICTRPEISDGRYTGALAGPVLWGQAKADAVRAFAARHNVDLGASYGYANGDEDLAFLESVGHPAAVNPSPGLLQAATNRGWPVLSFAARRRPDLMDATRTIAAYGGLATGCGLGALLGLANGSRRHATNIAFSVGSDVGLSLAGVRLDVRGRSNLWLTRPAVFVFNHQSLLDGWVAINLLRQDFTGVGKKEMGRVPVLAQFAWLTNVALIDRHDSAQARAALEPVLDRLRDGYSVVLAPEGTRSVTSRMGPWKKGAFHLAMQAQVPVVPIVIRNAGELQWRGSHFIRTGTIDVAVLPPVDVSGWKEEELTQRVADVRQQVIDVLDDWPEASAPLGC